MTTPTDTINTITPPFRTFYDNMAAIKRADYVAAIINACDISERTFYYWLDHASAIKKPAREKIALLSGKTEAELFETPQTVKP